MEQAPLLETLPASSLWTQILEAPRSEMAAWLSVAASLSLALPPPPTQATGAE